jgi:hypothetical protein
VPLERRFGTIDSRLLGRARELLAGIQQEIPPTALKAARLVNARTAWRFAAELKALARQTGIDWRWLMVANISYDLALMHLGCSTAALASPEGPIVARNMDWWPEDKLAAASCLLRYVKGDRPQFAVAGWPGSVGVVTGLSARRFAVVLNAVLSPEPVRKTGYPVLLFLRKVLEDAEGFDQAVAMLTRQKLFAGALLTVVGATNHQRVVIERTPTQAVLRRPAGLEPLVTTNHYRSLSCPARPGLDEQIQSYFDLACGRYDSLTALSAQFPTDTVPATEALLYALSDAKVSQTITAQQIILQPSRQRMELYVPRRLAALDADPTGLPAGVRIGKIGTVTYFPESKKGDCPYFPAAAG